MKASKGAIAHDTSGYRGTDLERMAEVKRLAVVAQEAMERAQALVFPIDGPDGVRLWSAASNGTRYAAQLWHAADEHADHLTHSPNRGAA